MYETEGTAAQQKTKPVYLPAKPSIPQYGGDCALSEDGLASSTKRLQDTVTQLLEASYQLRQYFGLDCPLGKPEEPRPSGYKYDIDGIISCSRTATDNLRTVLQHINS